MTKEFFSGRREVLNGLREGPTYNIRTVCKIYTPIFTFFQKRVVNIAILELGPVPNESPGNFTYYRGIL